MKKILGVLIGSLLVSSVAFAQFGNLLNKVQNNPLLTQQGNIQSIISKAQAIAGTFAQMPLNSGKLEFIKAALPLLTQAQSLSTNPAQTDKIGGVLDQVKSLIAQKWSASPLTQAQVPQATAQAQQFTGMLTSILNNEGGALKGLLKTPSTH